MAADEEMIPVRASHFAAIATMLGNGMINSGTAKKLVQILWQNDIDPTEYVKEHGWEQIRDRAVLEAFADQIIASDPRSVQDYRNGKTAALQALIGQIMAKTGGKADPVLLQQILHEKL